jgi:hypothetical protein
MGPIPGFSFQGRKSYGLTGWGRPGAAATVWTGQVKERPAPGRSPVLPCPPILSVACPMGSYLPLFLRSCPTLAYLQGVALPGVGRRP